MYDLNAALERFDPITEQEARDKSVLLALLSRENDLYSRAFPAHLTASAWVVNHGRDKALMAFHNIYKSWSWLGGHADGEKDLPEVALREVREESGVSSARLVSPDIFSVEILTVDGHEKRGEFVSSHLHLNVTYLIEADENDPLFVKADENSAVRWFALSQASAASTEPWMRQYVYEKLNRRLRAMA